MEKLEGIRFEACAYNDAFKGLGIPFVLFCTIFPRKFDVGGRKERKQEAAVRFGAMEEFMWRGNFVWNMCGG